MDRFITIPVLTNANYWAVARGTWPDVRNELYDSIGNIKKRYINEIKFYKKKSNAEKFIRKASRDQWIHLINLHANNIN